LVALVGRVRSRRQQRRAFEIAAGIAGVRRVSSAIELAPPRRVRRLRHSA
jgi:osmotically-inducible protein OsmY